MAEVYAGFSEYTDAQVGRIVDYLEESGQLDNTLIFYCADNGASGEGSPNGSVNEGKFFNGYPDNMEDNLPMIDRLGTPGHLQPLPDGLGGGVLDAVPDVQALRVPGRGVRPAGHPLAGRDRGAGEVRHQYHHSTDIVPTILECCGVEFPEIVNGVDADAAARRVDAIQLRCGRRADRRRRRSTTRCSGNRGIWHQGWKAVTEHGPMTASSGFEDDRGSCSTPTRTAPRRTTSPTSTRRRSRSSRRCGSRRPRPTTCCR